MSLEGDGGRGRGGTFSSKKVDCTQESGNPGRKRERQEKTRGQITSRYQTNYVKLPVFQVQGAPHPESPSDPSQ